MNIQAIDATGIVKPAANTATVNATTAPAGEALGQDTFLRLLVEQLKNQDPLNPQDSAQFVAQLAQFSSLQELTSINARLGQLLTP
jgi:flagellar basal-body rod modification protein FlgD